MCFLRLWSVPRIAQFAISTGLEVDPDTFANLPDIPSGLSYAGPLSPQADKLGSHRSANSADEIETDRGQTARDKRRDHSYPKPKDQHGSGNCYRECPRVQTVSFRHIEGEQFCPDGCRLVEQRVNREPDGEVQDHANNCSSDRRESRIQCLNASSCSMKGAPTKIQRKQGINVTQVASRPTERPGHQR